jgi:NDP-sugar pyrophosphorylase family protein
MQISDIPVALLAGGLASRLGPISRETPKALVEVNGRPFIDHQFALLHRHGIRRIVLCVGHLGEQIRQHAGDGRSRGLEIRYSDDGSALAGTGGAVRRALPLLGDLFWVMYGDSYMDIDYRGILRHFTASPVRRLLPAAYCPPPSALRSPNSAACADALGLMTVIRNDNRWDRSNAIFENGRLTCYDKRNRSEGMRYIDYGVQLLRREALANVPAQDRCDLADLYRGMVAQGRMAGYEVFNRFYEIGTPGALEETGRYLSSVANARCEKVSA